MYDLEELINSYWELQKKFDNLETTSPNRDLLENSLKLIRDSLTELIRDEILLDELWDKT